MLTRSKLALGALAVLLCGAAWGDGVINGGGGGPTGAAGGGLTGTYPNPTVATVPASALPSGVLTNSLASPVVLNNTGTFFPGPTVAQGTSGTWFASGTVTMVDTVSAKFNCKLWDGTTTVASGASQSATTSTTITVSLSGRFVTPAGNIRMDCEDATSVNGNMLSNTTGINLDSTITVYRIN